MLLATSLSLCASDADERIEASARNSSIFKTHLKKHSITIKSADGVVTLNGNAANAAEKAQVTKLVTNINGVKSVVNHMTVGAVASTSSARIAPARHLRIISQ